MSSIAILLIIISAIFFPGIINIVKAKLGGRRSPSVFQPLYDVIRLLKKQTIYGKSTSFIFKLAPIVYFASVVTALILMPVGKFSIILSFPNNFIVFSYILALGKFLMIIGALDVGSGFEGMGANREAFYSMLIEPAFFIILGTMALFTDMTSFPDMFRNMHINSALAYSLNFVIIFILINIALTENSRLPVDDPKTHLELTMVHEVMILDNSSFDLALFNIASWLKFAIYGTFISNLIVNPKLPIYLQISIFIVTQIIFAIVIGVVESFTPRNKMSKNPQWIINLIAFAVLVFMVALVVTQKIILN